jgi:hypothetical protein
MTENSTGKQKMRLGTLNYPKIWQENQYRARTVPDLPAIIVEKRKLRLDRLEISINDQKNETASKAGVVFQTEALFSLKYSGPAPIKMHFLQNE